jgi:hypothetical protein
MIGFGDETPFQLQTTSVDGEEWVKQLADERSRIQNKLTGIHKTLIDGFNSKHKPPQRYKEGDLVWVELRDKERDKLNIRWRGPVEILGNPHHDTYTVEVMEGPLTVNVDRLKPYFPAFEGDNIPLHYHRPPKTHMVPEKDTHMVEDILDHRFDSVGRMKWKVRWKDSRGAPDDTWELASAFIPSYNVDWAKYNQRKKISVGIDALVAPS